MADSNGRLSARIHGFVLSEGEGCGFEACNGCAVRIREGRGVNATALTPNLIFAGRILASCMYVQPAACKRISNQDALIQVAKICTTVETLSL